jgi:hypothetical protein
MSTCSARLRAGAIVVVVAGSFTFVPAAEAKVETRGTVTWGEPIVEEFDTFDAARWFRYQRPSDLTDVRQMPHRDPDLVEVGDGTLRLLGRRDAEGMDFGSAIGDRSNLRYGRWEVRFRVSDGPGFGAVVLLWPADGYGYRWPDDGEIDLIEVPRGDRLTHNINSVHLGPTGISTNGVAADFSEWHTVSVDWLPGSLTYYLDGIETWKAPAELVPSAIMRLALQLDECAPDKYHGFIECRPDTSSEDVVMEVDWVKVFPFTGDLPVDVGSGVPTAGDATPAFTG